ncbi:MAG: prepilin-type N-terminal cleavage/methylation domain-containing protein [Elusimicrobiaceae bacterium]|nr:prepilin-type N-terminal cleavage/methylation domain-containing protein [Elusimicrobiaceae bacterium]
MKKVKKAKRTGFTLVEILVVIMAIAILTAVSVPLYNKIVVKSDVSDALNSISMFAQAQNKHFISKGAYANNINDLETPLKSTGNRVVTTNYSYFVGSVGQDDYCIYAKSNSKDYMLAKNYKRNSKIVCSGADCSKANFVNSENFNNICTGNIGCDTTCEDPYILNEEFCRCDCANGNTQETCSGNYTLQNCECACNLTEDFCDIDQIFNAEQCQCEPDPGCTKTCNSPFVLNEEECECECGLTSCDPGYTLNNQNGNCACECDKTIETCKAINPNYTLQGCECVCDLGTTCGENETFNPDLCQCVPNNECQSPQVPIPGSDDQCGCLINGGANPPYLFNANGSPDSTVSGVVPVGTPCSESTGFWVENYVITEDCTCECDEEAQIRTCGGIQFQVYATVCGECPYGNACLGAGPINCPPGKIALDPCFCEPIVECPSGQAQVPSPSIYEIMSRCACKITTGNSPYVWDNEGYPKEGYFPPGTRCSNNPNEPSIPGNGRLTDDCRCI